MYVIPAYTPKRRRLLGFCVCVWGGGGGGSDQIRLHERFLMSLSHRCTVGTTTMRSFTCVSIGLSVCVCMTGIGRGGGGGGGEIGQIRLHERLMMSVSQRWTISTTTMHLFICIFELAFVCARAHVRVSVRARVWVCPGRKLGAVNKVCQRPMSTHRDKDCLRGAIVY